MKINSIYKTLVILSIFLMEIAVASTSFEQKGSLVQYIGDKQLNNGSLASSSQWVFKSDKGISKTVLVKKDLLKNVNEGLKLSGNYIEVKFRSKELFEKNEVPIIEDMTFIGKKQEAPNKLFQQDLHRPWLNVLIKFSNQTGALPFDKVQIEYYFRDSFGGMEDYWKQVSDDTINISGTQTIGFYTLPNSNEYYVYDVYGDGIIRLDHGRFNTDVDNILLDYGVVIDNGFVTESYYGLNVFYHDEQGEYFSYGAHGGDVFGGKGRTTINYIDSSLIAHEMGHGYGLPHSSNKYDFEKSGYEYGNYFGVMGDSGPKGLEEPLNPYTEYNRLPLQIIGYHKSILNLLPEIFNSSSFDTTNGYELYLQKQQDLSLVNYSTANVATSNPDLFYMFEVRDNVDYDFLFPAKSIHIYEVDESRGGLQLPASLMLYQGDGQPIVGGESWRTGDVFTDNAHNITVEILSEDADGFNIRVTAPNPQPSISTIIYYTRFFTDKVWLGWKTINNADHYKLYRCNNSDTNSCSEIYSGSSNSFSDYATIPGIQYYYRVKSCNYIECSSYSEYKIGSRIIPDSIFYNGFEDTSIK